MKKLRELVFLLFVFVFYAWAQNNILVNNPYDGVVWEEFIQHKASLHVHTTASDGKLHPHEIVDRYRRLGYTILAITDHDYMNKNKNRMTFPWEQFKEMVTSKNARGLFESRIPEKIGMLAVKGNELSLHHHTGSYFNEFEGSDSIETSLSRITEIKGIAVLFHPGRYKNQYSFDWYLRLFKKFPVLVGIEVYNQGNRYPDDRIMWDSMLVKFMPDRPIWGFSNDDAHKEEHIGRNYNVFLLQNLSLNSFREAMEKGRFYFIYSPDGCDGKPARIKKITVDTSKGTIKIEASDCERIEWISQGIVAETGNEISYRNNEKINGYLRSALYGIDGKSITETQPFGILRK